MQKILVAVDGTDASLFALDFAADLAQRLDAELVLFTVAEHHMSDADSERLAALERLPTSVGDVAKIYAEDILDRAERRARTFRGIEISSHWRVMGDPTTEIAAYARSEPCDLIVVGHRDRGLATQMILGSVARKLLEIAPCPVTIVPERL